MNSEPLLVTAAVVMKPDGALLLARRRGELVLQGHDGHRRVSLSGVERFASLRAEVQP